MKGETATKETVGERLVELRGARTRVGVAREIGISGERLANFERGFYRVPDELKGVIAHYYGKTIQEVFFDP